MAKRNLTNGDTTPALSEQQRTACDLIVAGRNLQDVAEAVSVARPTVSRWLNHEPAFIAAVNARRQDLWENMVDELRGLLPRAVQVLKAELDGPQPCRPRWPCSSQQGSLGAWGGPPVRRPSRLSSRRSASGRWSAPGRPSRRTMWP